MMPQSSGAAGVGMVGWWPAELRNVTDMEDISIYPCKKWNIGVKCLGVHVILKQISSFGEYLATELQKFVVYKPAFR